MTACKCERTTIRLVGHAAHEDEHDTEVPDCVVKAMAGAREYADVAGSGIAFLKEKHDTLVAENAELRKERDELRLALIRIWTDSKCQNTVNAPRCGYCETCELSEIASQALARTKHGSQG